AAQQGDVEATRRLIAEGSDVNVRDKWGITTLHRAVGMGQTAVVKVLLEAGADVNAAEPEGGMTPLHSAANRGQTEAAKLLLEAGADVNAKAKGGETPLSLAVARGNTEVANLFREHGGTE
ncbi:MAG: ankyrin repeat domain-containing protein, partial [Armatimonadetes bacterium]|nr:ankyrin repeat domain-containing protein [Armatimonadota bacterium]